MHGLRRTIGHLDRERLGKAFPQTHRAHPRIAQNAMLDRRHVEAEETLLPDRHSREIHDRLRAHWRLAQWAGVMRVSARSFGDLDDLHDKKRRKLGGADSIR